MMSALALKGRKAKALYDFHGENEDELSFKVGDIITELESVDDDWMSGELLGKSGIFPKKLCSVYTSQLKVVFDCVPWPKNSLELSHFDYQICFLHYFFKLKEISMLCVVHYTFRRAENI